MVNSNELLYVVDEFDTPMTPKPRHEVFEKGFWRRTVHVWIMNRKGEILCQKRSAKKDISPGKWEPAVVGHIGPEDNYFTGAARELFEETGLEVKPEELNLVKIYKDHETREYRGVFFCKLDVGTNHIVSEEDEVDEVKFIKKNTLRNYLLYKKYEHWIKPGYEKEMFSILN